jgi:transposase
MEMLRVDYSKWEQTPEDLLRLAVEAAHARTRERFLALYQITHGYSAAHWAQKTERHDDTVQHWVHVYNEQGPAALEYRHTGGRLPFRQRSSTRSKSRSRAAYRLLQLRP